MLSKADNGLQWCSPLLVKRLTEMMWQSNEDTILILNNHRRESVFVLQSLLETHEVMTFTWFCLYETKLLQMVFPTTLV